MSRSIMPVMLWVCSVTIIGRDLFTMRGAHFNTIEKNLSSVCNVGLIKFLNSMVFRCSYLVLKSQSFDSGLMCSGIDPFYDFDTCVACLYVVPVFCA
jgi:hypothetical protein